MNEGAVYQSKLNIKVLFWVVSIYFFAFQRVLIDVWNGFNYFDELWTIVAAGTMIFLCFSGRKKLTNREWIVLVLWVLICFLGVVSNILYEYLDNYFYVCVDVLSTIKVWLAYYSLIMTSYSKEVYDNIIVLMAKIGRMLTIIMFLCMLLSYVVDLGMTASARMGIPSYQFLFNVPGNYSKFFYFLIPLLTSDLYYKKNLYKMVIICMALVTWASTMRSRAFAFIAIYILLIVYYLYCSSRYYKIIENKIKTIKLRYLAILSILAVAISWKQIIFYFTTDTQARSLLLRYGLITMQRCFPLGSGFGTYGSDIAATHYSILYEEYGFNNYYGMRETEALFLNDNYWPMVMGQFGIIGLVLAIIALFVFVKLGLDATQKNRFFYISVIVIHVFLMLSSVASKSYSEFSSISVFMLIALLVARERTVKKEHLRNV